MLIRVALPSPPCTISVRIAHFQTNRLAGLAISIPKLLFIPNVAFLLRGTTPTPPKAAKVDGLGGSFAGLIANPCRFEGVKY